MSGYIDSEGVKHFDTAPDLLPERRQAVRLEMIRWIASDGDALKRPMSLRQYMLNTVSVYAMVRHYKAGKQLAFFTEGTV